MKPVELDIGNARATLLPERGGLLTSLALQGPARKPHEIIWLPPDFKFAESGWPQGGAPILFPFAGRVFDEGHPLRYSLNGESFNMPLHGFAYALPWELIAGSNNRAALRLTSSEKTLELYPYNFELTAAYELFPSSLKIDLAIANHGAAKTSLPYDGKKMPVAAGIHPFFSLPMLGGNDFSQCYLDVAANEQIQVTPAGAAGKASPHQISGPISLKNDLYSNLILTGFEKPEARLIDQEAELAINVRWHKAEHLRHLVLWGKEDQGFYCIEPWMGQPNAVSTGAGCYWLETGHQLVLHFEISLTPLSSLAK